MNCNWANKMSPVSGTDLGQSHPPHQSEGRTQRRRSHYLSATALARSAAWGGLPTALMALPLALTPVGASAAAFDITAAGCLITGTLCNASVVLPPATSANFKGGVLTLDDKSVPGPTYLLPFTLNAGAGNTINQAGNEATFSGVFADSAPAVLGRVTLKNVDPADGTTQLTTGSVTFTATNTYHGLTTISTGSTLVLSGKGSIENSSNVTDSGTFDISPATTGNVSIVGLSGGGSVLLGGNTLTLTNPATKTFSGKISGDGGVTIAGGDETFSGGTAAVPVKTYKGLTRVDAAATLNLSGAGGIGASSGVVANGTFDVHLTTGTNGSKIQSLSGENTGSVLLGARTLTLTNASGIFKGVISDGAVGSGGGLTISKGTETLMGANTFTGAATIGKGATLQGTGSVAGAVVNNGTVRPFDTVSNKAGSFTIAGSYSRTAGQSDIMDIAFGGSPASGNYARLAVKGSVTLGSKIIGGGSTLNVDTNALGFSFAAGDSTYDDILIVGSISGDFTSLSYNGTACTSGGPGSETWLCGSSLKFREIFDSTSLDLVVTQTPEPGTIAVLASGLLGLMALRRKRSSLGNPQHPALRRGA